MNIENNTMILGVQCKSAFSSLSLAERTCPLGLLTILSQAGDRECWIFNEEVSGECTSAVPDLVNRAEVVLLSAHSGNIMKSLRFGRELSKLGKVVYIGGPEPSMIGPALLRDHPYLTGLVVGAGERTLANLLSGFGKKSANVFVRDKETFYDPLQYICPATRIDFENIRVDYRRLWDLLKHRGVSYLWGNDCTQARERCFFCGRISLGLGYRPAELIWDELLYVYRQGLKFFYNTTDSVTTNIRAFKAFCDAKPLEMKDDIHRVFVNANRVNLELVDSLHRLNGVAVIGIESFGRLEETGKLRTYIGDNLSAVNILARNGVHMVLSFVYGLPKETPETIDATELGIVRLVEEFGHMIDSIHLSPLLVTTGSPAWRRLMALPMVRCKYSTKKVPYDVIEVTNDYFNYFCSVTRDYCIERIFALCSIIRSRNPKIKIGAKGILKSEELPQEVSQDNQLAGT